MIKNLIQKSIDAKVLLLEQDEVHEIIEKVAKEAVRVFEHKGKVLLCGNGGSAADAQHIAAELSGRFYYDRAPLHAEALHVNSSFMTAVANDYGYDEVFARMTEAAGKQGDMLIGISTSGNSKSIVKAIEKARALGMVTVGMTGQNGGALKDICTFLIKVPSEDTPRIQECHILIGHILCEIIEKKLFPKQ